MFYVRLKQARCNFSICLRPSNFVRQWKGRSLPDSSHPDSNSYGQIFSSHGIKNWFLLWDVGFHDEWPNSPMVKWDYVGLCGIFPYFPIFHGGFWILSGCNGGTSTKVQMGTTTPDFHRMEARDIQMPEDSRLEAVNSAGQKTGKGSSSGPSGWDSLVNSGEFWRVEMTFSMGKDRWWIFDEHSLTLIKYDVAISLISEYLVS